MSKAKPKAATPLEGARPLNDYIIVRRKDAEQTSSGEHGVKIIVPERHSERPLEGIAVAVGKGRILESGQRVPVDVEVGDRVLFSKFSGTEQPIDGIMYTLLREQEVLVNFGPPK